MTTIIPSAYKHHFNTVSRRVLGLGTGRGNKSLNAPQNPTFTHFKTQLAGKLYWLFELSQPPPSQALPSPPLN